MRCCRRPEEFKDFSDFEITKAGKTLTAVLTMEFTQRDVTLTYVMSSPSMEVTAVNAEVVLSLGEKMSNAGINTLINFGIVFVSADCDLPLHLCFPDYSETAEESRGTERVWQSAGERK